jgi:hypothetical protein
MRIVRPTRKQVIANLSMKPGVCHIIGCRACGRQRVGSSFRGAPRVLRSFACHSGWHPKRCSPALCTPAVVMAAMEKSSPQYQVAFVVHGLSAKLYHEKALDITPATRTLCWFRQLIEGCSCSQGKHEGLAVMLIRSRSANLCLSHVSISSFLRESSGSWSISSRVTWTQCESIRSSSKACVKTGSFVPRKHRVDSSHFDPRPISILALFTTVICCMFVFYRMCD